MLQETLVRITPADHGQRMSLDDFAEAEAQEGYLYELAMGVVQVVQIPKPPHGVVAENIRTQIGIYQKTRRRVVRYVASGANCKLLLPGMESERHPDIAVYLSPMPRVEPAWHHWIPDVVVEVVSPGQEKRDYEEKREEYLAASVREYWIIDPAVEKALFLRRTGDRWQEVSMKLEGVYDSAVLPGFQLELTPLLDAWREASL
jgi:Uma2 family endonuclease